MSDFENPTGSFQSEHLEINTYEMFTKLIQEEQYVGDLYATNYELAKVLVHDSYREKVGGIPSLCFLIATRVSLQGELDFKREDSSIILLRVMDSTAIPQDREVEKVRIQTAQRVTGLTDKNWDHKDYMDEKTRSVFGFAGISCRVVGTFFLEEDNNSVRLKFGTDLSNFYSNMALKVFKPKGEALELIVNYIDPKNLESHKEDFGNAEAVRLGKVRYASTNRKHQGVDDVPTFIYPADLLAQKTALFGMTRTGKSNTTKIIAKSVYELRHPKNIEENISLRIGQVIFDPNGEYANENTQDASGKGNATALKNIWESHCRESIHEERLKERNNNIVIYGLHPHDKDLKGQERTIMKLNFYDYNMLENGKSIVNIALEGQDAQYFTNFKQVEFHKPIKEDYDREEEFFDELKRYYRRTLSYFALLKKAGLEPPKFFKPKMKFDANRFLFSKELRDSMSKVELQKDKRKEGLIRAAAETLGKEDASWDSLPSAFEGLFYFLETEEYSKYNIEYIKKSHTGQGFTDSDFDRILEMFKYSKGANLIGKVSEQHDPNSSADYADEIYRHLLAGKLVIIDQSSGNETLNKASAERIMTRIFKGNQEEFRKGKRPKDILVYIEEAHNLLPSGKDIDLTDIWVRTAKEGGKYQLGLVYATQEVSSIQRNILRNTANWFISHLNNTDETRELIKYYDFADFEPSIRRAQDKGFLRVKTLNSPFIVPMQIDKFEIRINE